jgi:hypothetical protein
LPRLPSIRTLIGVPPLALGEWALQRRVLHPARVHEVLHLHHTPPFGGQEGGVQRYVPDVASRHREAGQPVVVQLPVPTKPYRWGYSLRATC